VHLSMTAPAGKVHAAQWWRVHLSMTGPAGKVHMLRNGSMEVHMLRHMVAWVRTA